MQYSMQHIDSIQSTFFQSTVLIGRMFVIDYDPHATSREATYIRRITDIMDREEGLEILHL